MGLRVNDNFDDVKDYTLTSYNFNHGNEYVLHFMNEKGKEKRKRISAKMKDMLEDFAYIELYGEGMGTK